MHFNTAIARMMEFINGFSKLDKYPKSVVKMATQMLYPFAPHISEEIWHYLGEEDTITYAHLPKASEKYLEDDMINYVVQVNGKLRDSMHLEKDMLKDEILDIAMQQPNVKRHLTGDVVKVIFVPNKLINIVIKKN
jgi:leucyl-tRNA synthetase